MKTIKTTYLLFTCVFLAWLALSWLDVIINNTAPGGVLSEYNAFIFLFNNLDHILKGCIF
jgi:hypothetical protein